MTKQESLTELYRPLVERSAVLEGLQKCQESEEILKKLYGPFLISVDDQYESSSPRVAIVGQENNGWMKDHYHTFLSHHCIEDSLSEYRRFNIIDWKSGCFGRYVGKFRDQLVGPASDTNRRAILYNNLFKLNHEGACSLRSPYLAALLELQGDIFPLEMEILAPNVVIFLTGPRYDKVIKGKGFYPDADFQTVDSYPKNELVQIKDRKLPTLTFRTYHPGYLNRVISKKPYCIDAIVERVKQQFPGS